MILTIELIPSPLRRVNLRSILSREQWAMVRRYAYAQSGYTCGICDSKKNVDTHEAWSYDEKWLVQILDGVYNICRDCHNAKHLIYSNSLDADSSAAKRLKLINDMSDEEVCAYMRSEMIKTKKLSENKSWKTNILKVRDYGIFLDTYVFKRCAIDIPGTREYAEDAKARIKQVKAQLASYERHAKKAARELKTTLYSMRRCGGFTQRQYKFMMDWANGKDVSNRKFPL